MAALSYGVLKWLDKEPRAIWEVARPERLLADKGEPAGAARQGPPAGVRPSSPRSRDLREEGQSRLGLSKFARSCERRPACSSCPTR